MIKTVKVKKKLRLDELIKYVIDKGLDSFQYTSDNNVDVYFTSNGHFMIAGDSNGYGRSVELSDTFTVEVEEVITEDTNFMWLVEASDTRIWTQSNASISDVIDERTKEIRALINGKLELIWEAE